MDEEFDEDDPVDADDFVFVIDARGDLKVFMCSDDIEDKDFPATVKKIMKMFNSKRSYNSVH
jgi:hypothetical protein